MQRLGNGQLVFGRGDGPQIQVIPLTPGLGDLFRGVTRALQAGDLEWFAANDKQLIAAGAHAPGQGGVVGLNTDLAVRLLYPSKLAAVQALHDIESSESATPLPVMLCSALLTAARGIERRVPRARLGQAVWLASRAAEKLPIQLGSSMPSKVSRYDLQAYVKKFFDPLLVAKGKFDLPPLSSVDRARLALEVGRYLWEPVWRTREVASLFARAFLKEIEAGEGGQGAIAILAYLAGAEVALRADPPRIEIAGVKLRVEEVADFGTLYMNTQGMTASGVPTEVIRALMPDGKMVDSMPDAMYAEPTDDPVLLQGLSAGFIQTAEEQAMYAPFGAFRLDLPKELPIVQLGVKALSIYCDMEAQTLWARVHAPQPVGPIIGWSPFESRKTNITGTTAWLNLVLAALWHDLRVGGEEAVPLVAPAAPRAAQPTAKLEQPATTKSDSVRYLPAPRRLSLSGKRQWGTPAERAQIARQAHAVRGHLRRLSEGRQRSEEAAQVAIEFGVVLPGNFTFVRPHVRGRGDAEAGTETLTGGVVRARGLGTLVALLGGG